MSTKETLFEIGSISGFLILALRDKVLGLGDSFVVGLFWAL